MIKRALNKVFRFGYDATCDHGRRRSPRIDLKSEDRTLRESDRRKLVSTTRDLRRNMSIPAWAIRKHLDFVSTFSFQCRSGDTGLDREIESFMSWWSRPQNCDVAGRHSLSRMIRLAEEARTVDGDVGLLKLSDGRLQAIEGDRIRTPSRNTPANFDKSAYVHGVKTSPAGKALAYCICERCKQTGDFRYKTVIPARHILMHGFYSRFDQVRGISPLASAINTFADLYEAQEFALAKAKLSQYFGIKFIRDADEAPALVEGEGEFQEKPPYEFKFGKGPQLLDLDPGDDAQFLESQTPSTEFQSFSEQMIASAIKALDIPTTFYDSRRSSYSASRQELLLYEQSAQIKRNDVRDLLNHLTHWRLSLSLEDGMLALPAGMPLSDLKWEWIANGLPWIDPLKEAKADIAMVEAGLRSRQEIAKSRGRDWQTIADELATEKAYMQKKGLCAQTTESADRNSGEKDDH